MDLAGTIAKFQRLREESQWRLLASDHAPYTLSLLKHLFHENQQAIAASVFTERLSKALEVARSEGAPLSQSAQTYLSNWVAEGYLVRRLSAGASEEVLELTAATAGAIRLIESLRERRQSATESRLHTVIQQLVRLADETNPDSDARLRALISEQERLAQEIDLVRQGKLQPLHPDRALERAREIIGLAEDLAADFRNVRDGFEQLNRDLRQRLITTEGSRGIALEQLFAGVDVITESEAGRTFTAFWRLLTDPEQSSVLEGAVAQVMQRKFSSELSPAERKFLARLIKVLLEQGGNVHESLQAFARGLKQFVQSREYLEQRRMNQLLNEAQSAAFALKEHVGPGKDVGISLALSTTTIRSLSQWTLYDPSQSAFIKGMSSGDVLALDLETVSMLVAESEINFRELKGNVRAVLSTRDQVTVGQVMEMYPPSQGLGSVVGYLMLGSRHGVLLERQTESICWNGGDDTLRRASIPTCCFVAERLHELE
jgi:hypothetical protein